MQWDVVWNNFDYFLWGAFPNGPLGGLAVSILLAVLGIFGAFWIGLAAGLMRLSRNKLVKITSVIYIEVIRGVPLLMLIFWFYFLAPVVLGTSLPEFHCALIAFIVFTGAYIAEIVKAGVVALPSGQMEAARGTGLSHYQAMRFVILPQALRNMIPSFVNQFVSLTKDTSLAYIIGVNELTRTATQVNNRTLSAPTEIFITIAVLYFIVCYVLTYTSRRMEKHLARYQARDR
ncbi:amino acid ABC transporter membrane protein 2, PAAT family (TC 3.A.1.3.-) [Maridesulfovibrio ferrireducens]|uniref:Glutamate/aspartate import permease protein GltK n=1 Tax=Maridesulfovibrio ferrireducens TaxID=246191 RepID=A0A1G9EFI4_9BACT|nr:amino acid ABC transporter permease [Maridesulfovibrio ferrireducens]SDK74909.1 amino acid ABC transporter membrane protein 2, PAAT family (TC 3.A.1.3.-) [Maridesulfovibrio ferrireducens]